MREIATLALLLPTVHPQGIFESFTKCTQSVSPDFCAHKIHLMFFKRITRLRHTSRSALLSRPNNQKCSCSSSSSHYCAKGLNKVNMFSNISEGERDNDRKAKPPRPSFPGGALVPKAAAGGAGTGAGGAGRWRAAVYEHQVFCPYEHSVNEHQLVTAASVGCTTRICTRAEAIQVWTNWNSVFLK